MFSKFNSRFLTLANVLLLEQVIVGVIYFLLALSRVIFPIGQNSVGDAEWMRTLTIVVMGLVLLILINVRWKIFDPKLTREEKAFKLATLAVFDIEACIAISFALTKSLETSELAMQSATQAMINAGAVAVVFLSLFLVVPRIKIFRKDFSRVLNFLLMTILLGLGWVVAWLIAVLTGGPDGSSEMTQAVYAQQVFRFAILAVFLVAMVGILVWNGRKRSKGRVATRTAEERGQKLLQAETVVQNRELKIEVAQLKREVGELKKLGEAKKWSEAKVQKRRDEEETKKDEVWAIGRGAELGERARVMKSEVELGERESAETTRGEMELDDQESNILTMVQKINKKIEKLEHPKIVKRFDD